MRLVSALVTLLVVTSSMTAQHTAALSVDVQGRFNTYAYYGEETPDELGREFGLGFDLYALVVTGSHTAVGAGLSYVSRGVLSDGGSETSVALTFQYLDFPVQFHWYMTGIEPFDDIKPYLFVGVAPGFYMDGKYHIRSGSDEVTRSVDSEEVVNFHLAARIGLGLDVPINDMFMLGIGAGYEHGILTPVPEDNRNDDYTILFNSIITRVTMRVWL